MARLKKSRKNAAARRNAMVQKAQRKHGIKGKHEPARKPTRFKAVTKWLRQQKKNLSNVALSIPRAPFARLVREIAQDFKIDVRFTKSALEALHEGTESYLIEVFRNTLYVATKFNKQGIDLRSMDIGTLWTNRNNAQNVHEHNRIRSHGKIRLTQSVPKDAKKPVAKKAAAARSATKASKPHGKANSASNNKAEKHIQDQDQDQRAVDKAYSEAATQGDPASQSQASQASQDDDDDDEEDEFEPDAEEAIDSPDGTPIAKKLKRARIARQPFNKAPTPPTKQRKKA